MYKVVDWILLVSQSVVDCCEPSGSVKGREVIDQLLKKDSILWS
jgi:hypothetical protein